jgi:3-oxoacyl-[acyl-carrier protein] reductase
MDLGIAGRTALIMGGSKGVGLATSCLLARDGVAVAVVARGTVAVDEAVAAITADGGKAVGVTADLTDTAGVPTAVATVRERLGDPDILVYNGVTPKSGNFGDVDEADFLDAYRLTVLGFSAVVRAVAPAMQQRRWGRIVTVGSRAVKMPLRSDEVPYVLANTTRVAAVGLSKTLANELGPYGITVNTIGTGRIATQSYQRYTEEHAAAVGRPAADFLEDKIRRIPLRRFGRPEEMAGLIAFLCSEAGGYVSGETINCDGGRNEAMF